jgi:hypothetical protein
VMKVSSRRCASGGTSRVKAGLQDIMAFVQEEIFGSPQRMLWESLLRKDK